MTNRVDTWVLNRKSAIAKLADMAASRPPQQMQSYLELAKESDVNFVRVGLLNKNAVSTAFIPLIDEQGKSTIGIDFSDRPYVPIIKRVMRPMLSDVFLGQIGVVKPRVLIIAPVIAGRQYNGFAFAVLDLQQISEHFKSSSIGTGMLYTLLDKNGNVIMTNRTDQTAMKPFVRGKGMLNRIDKSVSQWVPSVHSNTPISERWKKSFYVLETPVGDLAEWKLMLEQPVAPFQKALYDNYTGKLTVLFLILLGSLALAELLSRRIVATLSQLRTLTHDLPVRLEKDCEDIAWPKSGIQETSHLISNFKEMAESLSEQFIETRKINESLEHRVEERTAELLESEQRFRQMANTAPVLIWIAGTDKLCNWFNQVWLDFTGRSMEQEYGNGWAEGVHPDDIDRCLTTYKTSFDNRQTFSMEYRLRRFDGQYRWLLDCGVPLYESDKLSGFIGSCTDITERKQIEEQLIEAKTAAESATIAKSQFLANMSHEIRTPMNGILGMTQLLEMTELTEEQKQYIAALKLSGKNLLSLINDILDLSKIEAGKIVIESAEFSLNCCISDIVQLQKSVIFEKGLMLDLDVAGTIPHLLVGDQLRIKQILLNLLNNAVKFTALGSITISAQLLEQRDASVLIEIAVRDSGIGIAQENFENIFKAFTQEAGSTTRKYGGTGLGLTISRRLAELMGGTISVESTQGVGSRFTVTLPLTVGSESFVALEGTPLLPITWDDPPLRVLFVEDVPINITFGTALLKKLGFDFIAVENGAECLAALEQGEFDLVLMDIQMPVMNGEEALTEIRRKEQESGLHLPVIAVTAYSMRGDKEKFLAEGFDGYVSKPLAFEELIREMKRVVGEG